MFLSGPHLSKGRNILFSSHLQVQYITAFLRWGIESVNQETNLWVPLQPTANSLTETTALHTTMVIFYLLENT